MNSKPRAFSKLRGRYFLFPKYHLLHLVQVCFTLSAKQNYFIFRVTVKLPGFTLFKNRFCRIKNVSYHNAHQGVTHGEHERLKAGFFQLIILSWIVMISINSTTALTSLFLGQKQCYAKFGINYIHNIETKNSIMHNECSLNLKMLIFKKNSAEKTLWTFKYHK